MRNLMAHISEREAFFCRMRPLGDICKKRRKLYCLSKNDITSNCSTDSPVGPIVSGVPRIDAQFNGAYFIKRGLFLYDASFRRYLQKTEKIISSFKKLHYFKVLYRLTRCSNRFRSTTNRCVIYWRILHKEGTFSVGCSLYDIFAKNEENYFVFQKMTFLQTALPTHP